MTGVKWHNSFSRLKQMDITIKSTRGRIMAELSLRHGTCPFEHVAHLLSEINPYYAGRMGIWGTSA
jgi:hypothetical protein